MRLPYVHEMFAQAAERHPGLIAVESGHERLTYRELNDRSNQVAAAAVAAGVAMNDLIVIFAEDRKFIMEVVLGVLKAGAAFVPLSPATPRKRLEVMLAQCSPQWAIVQPELAQEFAPLAAEFSVQIIPAKAAPGSANSFAAPEDLDPDGMAYIFFTSGSTGKPKAIAGRLKAIDHFIRWEIEAFDLGPGSRVSQLMSPMFDAFMRDMFAPLCSGGTVCIPEDNGGVLDGEKLGRWIGEAEINLVHTVPSVFRFILNQTRAVPRWSRVRHVLLSGEPLLPADVKRWHELVGNDGGRLVNLYGPTETTMTKFVYMVQPEDQFKRAIPIGQPMKGAKAVVLDKNRKVCPPWRVGELYIRTPYRSLGYFRQPELTSEVFVQNPFSNDPADLVYRTGDLARVVDSGNFELLGRRDNQVKIRGVRIEMEEIEAVLGECVGVSHAALVAREETPGEKRLVAFVVAAPEAQITVGSLRNAMKEKLPDYMIPSAWGLLEKFPLTATGKVDRQALEKLELVSMLNGHDGRAEASTQTEEILCGIWALLLKLPSVGVHDNFFELGGHSLLATQLMSRIQDAFHLELPLRSLFESPTVAGLAKSIDLTTQQAGMELPQVQCGQRQGAIPLSYAQQRFWFIDQLRPSGSSYNIPSAVRIEGALDRKVLQECLKEIVRRHESLRTRFVSVAGAPQQVIDDEMEVPLPFIDLTSLPEGAREAQARKMAQKAVAEPFDLGRGPLLRAQLLALDEQRHVLVIAMHHIISDAWSIGLLEHEVSALYEALISGEPSSLPELPVQYPDFSIWQRKYINDEFLEKKSEYWKGQLASLEALELPADRPRPQVQTENGANVALLLSPDLTAKLKILALEEVSTLYMVLLGAFQVLLFRYTGQEDVAVGSPVAGRSRGETEKLIGCFINTLVMRTDLSGELGFKELVQRVKKVTLDAFAHQDVPFEKLVEMLQPERNLSRSPLFQVLFVLQNISRGELRFGPAKVTPFELESKTTKFDLTLILGETASGLEGMLQYNTDLFDAATIERLAGHLQTLLESIVSNPGQPVSELDIMKDVERRQILMASSGASRPWEQNYVHDLIEQQAARTPVAVAVEHAGKKLSYAELSSRSNQLARYLAGLGVGPEARVGIYMERGAEVLVGLLAALKAGAAYIPLDPAYPAERIIYMLDDGLVSVVLTRGDLAGRMPFFAGRIVNLDAEQKAIAAQSTAPLQSKLSPANLAYVIYTSGSSGKAKGVSVSHENLLVSTLARTDYYRDPVTGYLLLSSFSFDSSVAGIFWTLAQGGTLILPAEDEHADPAALSSLIASARASHLLALPSLYKLILKTDAPLDSLRVAIVAGESCPAEIVALHRSRLPRASLVNEYGPTEATVWSTAWRDDGAEIRERVPIGQPVANAQALILGRNHKLVPKGVAGELWIGGPGLTRGYLDRPHLTAERFIPDSFGEEPGRRLYQTGDLVRWNSSWNLEYLGRTDEQVKLRGFRIELGEIEAALRAHAGVKDAAVVLREIEGDKRLVGYLTPAHSSVPTRDELRRDLLKQLPDYMVPAIFVALEKLPLTPNGKLDRKSLPAPEQEWQTRQYVEPRDAVEQALCGILEGLLGVERIGANDNFFELGGHSLLATQVMSQVRSVFQVELPLRVLFEAPVISDLAERVRSAMGFGSNVAQMLARIERTTSLPLSYAQQRLWFLDQLEPGNVAYNAPLGVRLQGELDKDALQWSVDEIIRRHEVLRTGFPALDGKPVQEIVPELSLPIKEIDLSRHAPGLREEEARRLAQVEVERPFDLAHAPLLRARLIKLDEQDHVLLVTMHHIVSDGWSTGILVREFMQLYEARSKQEPSPLPEPLIQYADFAAWQRQWLQGKTLEEQMSYWRNQLAGIEPLNLPVDHRRTSELGRKGDLISFQISKELADKIQHLAREQGVTVFMTLLAALQVTLGKHAGQRDIAVGTAVANRNRSEVEGLIGFFVNTLVMRTQLKTDWTYAELLQQVRGVALDAYQHQDVPFEKLVEELQPERDLSRSPLFQVMLVLQNIRQQELRLPGIRLSGFTPAVEAPKFDLMLTLGESASGIVCSLSYASDLFERATMERLLEHFQLVLRAMAETPQRRIAETSLLTGAERQTTLLEWNRTSVDFANKYVHELFAEQAARTPLAISVKYEQRQLTYQDLNLMADRVARTLREKGAGPESLTGICLERSLELPVALLGVLKAGSAYMPMDPGLPAERLRYMVQDSGAALIVCSAAEMEKLSGIGAEKLKIEDLLAAGVAPEAHEKSLVSGDHPAYVIYTSGSTGEPKGAVLTHASLMNHMAWMQQAHPTGPDDRVLQKTVFTFDASVWEFYAPLLAGGMLVMARPGGHQDPEYLVRCLEEEAVTVLQLVPLQLRFLLEQQGIERCHSLKRVYCGGEVLSRDLVEAFYRRIPSAKLYNLYGPTETTIDATIAECSHLMESETAPIGKPIANTQVYVLDEACEPLPAGCWGELYIGGAGLGRGYLNRPALTAEKFVPHPFSTQDGDRLYRTGDQVRWLGDGNLEFLGRLDHQVKFRGHRLELGEIVAALKRHDDVEQAVVAVREDRGEKRLVAYVVSRREELGRTELRRHLQALLPEYAVPSDFVPMERLPLLPNGKVDRKALPAPAIGLVESDNYAAPRSRAEEILCDIWARMLNIERVGVHDNFFELGGDSILTIQVIAKAREAGLNLTARQIFERQTIAELAEMAGNAGLAEEFQFAPKDWLLDNTQRTELRRLIEAGAKIEDVYPLSSMQQGMLFHSLYEPGSQVYRIQLRSYISRGLEPAAFRRAWEEVVRRHAILRTAVLWEGLEKPLQVVYGSVELPWRAEDWRGLNKGEQEAKWLDYLREDQAAGMDFQNAPLMRLALMRTGKESYYFAWSFHHILIDGWCRQVLVKEVFSLYEAYCEGKPLELETPPVYRNYIAWLQQQSESKAEAFWRDELKGFTSPTHLGLEQAGIELQPGQERHGELTLRLSAELTQQFERLGRDWRITQNTIVQGAWALLLSRYSGEADVLFGATVSGRSAPVAGIESMMGLFINTLPVRVTIHKNETVAEFLKRLQTHQAEVREYEYSPLTKMQSWSDVHGMPLFNSLVVFENYPVDSALRLRVAKSISIEALDLIDVSNYPLTLIAHPGSELLLSLGYDRTIFPQASAERVLQQLCTILAGMAAGDVRELRRISMLDQEERRRVIFDHNQTDAAIADESLPQAFERQAAQEPDAVALEFEGQEITYRELNQRANQIAAYLRARGVGVETLVGISIGRSFDMIAGLLGILKAGGAYVPLDTEYPRERLAYMLKDTGVRVLLAHENVLGNLPEFDGQVICLDREWEQIGREGKQNPGAAASSANLAYVIYTSGSTGQPKGVAVEQRAVARLVRNTNYVMLGPEEVLLHLAPLSFDASTFEIWGALLNGARLVIAPPGTPTLEQLGKLIRDRGITTMWLTASLFHLMATEQPDDLKQVRQLLAGGEALLPGVVRQAMHTLEQGNVINGYGPTENTTFTCCYTVIDEEQVRSTVPIGKPIANTRAYVLDEEMEPVPAGMRGELYTGGTGLARGYLNRPDLTAEKFVPNPFATRPGERLYCTGDRVRMREDGNIDFIGRQDNQVKVHGFRIELGEIETALEQLAGVQQAAVVVREDDAGNKQLVAYVVAGSIAMKAQLREALAEKLPHYMIPANFVMLDTLPMSPNGKVDRKALPEPMAETRTGEGYVAPRTRVETILCGIWARLLKVDRVGVHDNFFELGGDSILSIQVIGRARESGIQLTPRQIFERQTIAELAEVAEISGAAETATSEAWSSRPVPLTPIQAAFFEWKLADPGYYNQAVMLELKPGVDSALLKNALEGLLQHHEVLRAKYERLGEQMAQVCSEKIPQDFYEYKDFSSLDEESQSMVLELDADRAQASLDLEGGRLVCAVEYDLGPAKNKLLLLVIHHLAVDGVSWRILLADLERGYGQLENGLALSLSKTASFRKWADWVHQYGNQEQLRQEITYWGASSRREAGHLPQESFVSGADETGEELETVSVSLDEEETRELLQQLPRVYHTHINDVLLTALGRVCAALTGSQQLLVDLEGHGREEVLSGLDLSQTVGWFTAIYPVLLEVEEDWKPGRALKQTKEQLRRVPNRGFGYGVLRYVCEDEKIRREFKELPHAEISFNYLGQFDQVFSESKLFLPAQKSSGRSVSRENRRQHLIDVGGIVVNGRLQIGWTHNPNVTRREMVEKAAQQYLNCLRQIIEHCRSEEAGGFTPSDFPLARLNQQQLDRFIGKGAGIEDVYGMSSMQQGLLFHALYEAGSSMHFLQLACHIRGGVVPRAFRRAWEEMVRRHAILRTAFLWEGLEQSVQIVYERVEVPWSEEDWTHLPAPAQQEKWQKFLQEDRRQGFDFRKAPLMRLALFKSGQDSYYFVWSTHHILMDGWCRPLLIGDVFNLFKSYREGKEPVQKRVPAYREYIAWLQRQDESKAEAFWKEYLSGFSGSHELGFRQHKRELQGEEPFGEKRAGIGRELTQQLEKLAREQQVTLNTIIQGAWALVLAGYTGHSDVIFGTTVSGRPAELPGVENMIGLFINTLPVRVRIKDEETVPDYLLRLQKRQLELRDYEYSPLPRVQSWSGMPRGIRLFESLVVFENYPADTAMEKQVDASMKIESVQNFDVTNYPVSVVAVPAKDMVLVFKYDRTLFAHETIERVFSQLCSVLQQMSAADARIGDISLHQPGQRQLLAEAWRTVELPPSRGLSIPALVAERALQAPQSPALITQGKQLSYAELDRCANQLARHLRNSGLAAGSCAGICVEKDSSLLVTMLAVLKAGAAFVVAQPEQPAARVTDILLHAEVAMIVAERPSQEFFHGLSAARVSLDADREQIDSQCGDALDLPVMANSAACLLYYSCPDGLLRGALVTHAALSSGTFPSSLAVGVNDRIATGLDLAAEGTCFEIFAALAAGGCVVSVPRQGLPPRKFAELLREQRVTVLLTSSAVLAPIATQFALALKKVRLIVIKDALWSQSPWWQLLSPEALERTYGVYEFGEGGGAAVMYPLKSFMGASGVFSAGSLTPGRKLYLLDRHLEPAPEGVPGEIYIGGEGISLHYEKLPERSAETFFPDPFSQAPGGRMYRTGDRARRLPDGSMELEPRKDGRLLIHGQRVELKEVEALLAQFPEVSDAAVLHEVSGEGEASLSAVLVMAEHSALEAESLRSHLAQRLPEFMVPGSFTAVSSIPRGAGGEVDVAALARKLKEGESEEPRNHAEEVLASIWIRLLKLERVSVHDNFFELGGDSILSVQVVTQAQEAGLYITPRQLFEQPTIAGLAEVAGTQNNTLQQDQGTIAGPVPLTPIQAAFFDWKLAKPSHFNQAVLLELSSGAQSELLEGAISGLLQQHDSLRMKFVAGESGWEQSCEEELPQGVYQRRDFSGLNDHNQITAMEQDANLAQGSLDLQRGPVMRAVEYDLGTARGRRLLLVVHHLVVDGVSWRTLLTDLERAYEQLLQGKPLNLGLKSTSYKRWSESLREHSREEQVRQELAYWCSEERRNVGMLPRDYEALPEEVTMDTIRNITLSLQEEETRELLQEVPQIYHTQINEVLLTAAGQVFCEWTGNSNILLDLEGHGREDLWAEVDLSRTVGWFTTLYPVLLTSRAGEQWEPDDSIQRTKEQLRGVPNRGFNYGVLRYLSEDRQIREQMEKMPRAEASFNYLGQLDAMIGEPRLFQLAAESSGKAAAGANRQPYVVSVNAAVLKGKLQVNWSYSEMLHAHDSIQKIAQRYMECLRSLLAHSRSEEAGGITPSDFPLAQVTEKELSHIAAILGK
jgi:amino acid adenylation domain-containing protein/non-ribosomal peptide synthase protein (TIGR01720 family)